MNGQNDRMDDSEDREKDSEELKREKERKEREMKYDGLIYIKTGHGWVPDYSDYNACGFGGNNNNINGKPIFYDTTVDTIDLENIFNSDGTSTKRNTILEVTGDGTPKHDSKKPTTLLKMHIMGYESDDSHHASKSIVFAEDGIDGDYM